MSTRTNIEALQALGLLVTELPPSQRMEYVRAVLRVTKPVSDSLLMVMEVVKGMAGISFEGRFERAKNQLEIYIKEGVSCLALGEDYYPEDLAYIYDPPTFLYVQGEIQDHLVTQKKLAIVGSRRSNREGEDIAFSFARSLVQESIIVVSGLALGIDSAAHKGALEQTSKAIPTIGVLGSGFNKFYPPYNKELRDKILSANGLIISQFPPDCPPYPANFLNRNRVIAGLSSATVVVQATARSGSLATARYALEEGRELLVVPGGIYDPRFEGSLQLLKQGAGLVTKPQDIFDALSIPQTLASKVEKSVGQPQSTLEKLLREEGRLHVDQLKRKLNSTAGIEAELLDLELRGVIEREAGNFLRVVKRE